MGIAQKYQDVLGVRTKEGITAIFLVVSLRKMVRFVTRSCIVMNLPVLVKTNVTLPMRSTALLVMEETKFVEPVKTAPKGPKESLVNVPLV